MADLFAEALMLVIKTVMVSVLLFGLVLFVSGMIAVVDRVYDKARTKKEKEAHKDDR